MSLDFELIMTEQEITCECCGNTYVGDKIVFDRNITHNLTEMADEAGIYEVLWRPEKNGYLHAKDIIPTLKDGLDKLEADPEYYKKFDSPNGWGLYIHFVPFVKAVLNACEEYPDAIIRTDV
jgi:hypothetical protein